MAITRGSITMFEAIHFPERLENPGETHAVNILSRTEGLTILRIPINFAKGGSECYLSMKLM